MHLDMNNFKKYRRHENDLTKTEKDREFLLNTLKEHEMLLGEWGYKEQCKEKGCTGQNRQGVFFSLRGFPPQARAFDLKKDLFLLPFISEEDKEQLKTLYISWCTTCGTYEIEFKK